MSALAGAIAAVLSKHAIVSVSGGTATGSTWTCLCGAADITPGVRDHAALLGRRHVAAAVEQIATAHAEQRVAAFRAEAVDELVVESMRHSGIAYSLCDAYQRAADLIRNLDPTKEN